MARKQRTPTKEVSKFGGTENLGKVVEENARDAPVKNVAYDLKNIEVESQTKLEHDEGHGSAVVIRLFEFHMNPEAFAQHPPTKQELFNAHHKGIEMSLWKDGFKIIPEANPRVVVDEKKMTYRIFVPAEVARGQRIWGDLQPQTLSNVIHG